MKSFDEVWELIVQHQGSDFRTKRGIHFSYSFGEVNPLVSGRKVLLIFLAEINLIQASKGSFEKAYKVGKCSGPGEYTGKKIGGQSYVWAILNDKRINAFD